MIKKFSLKNILIIVMACAFAALPLSGCTVAKAEDGAQSTAYAFVGKMAAQDYAGAYDYIYSFSSDVQSKQDFVDRFTNIYKALKVTAVSLVDQQLTPTDSEGKEYELKYTLKMDSELLGSRSYEFTADVASSPLRYTVIYDPSLILPMMEEGDKVRVTNQYGVRGEIFAGNGDILAKNDFAQSIYLDLDKKPDMEEIKSFLVSKYGGDAEKIQKKYDKATERGTSMEVLLSFPRNTLTQAQIDEISAVNGLGVDDSRMTPTRYYPLADNAAHLVGYMNEPTAEQLEKNSELTEGVRIGQVGIEAAYESTLRSTDGRIIYIEDNKGELKEVLYEDAKSDGSDVYLTVDPELQNAAYTLMASNLKEDQSGAVVVMDYTNGDVKAIVSYPSYDPNLFNFPMDQDIYKYYSSEENLSPLFSRTTQALYMPGSTFKPFTAAPMFEEGVMDESSSPELDIQNNKWTPNVEGWHHSVITRVSESGFTFEEAMKSSDNIFFAYFGIRLFQKDPNIIPDYMAKIGIGEAPNFELPMSKSSLMNKGSVFDIGMAARSVYGMGELHITPLQLCSMYTAFMNDGDILNPTVVRKVSKTDGTQETIEWEHERTIFKENIMQTGTIDRIKPSLRRVIEDGTAWEAGLRDVSGLIAKTGTANIGMNNEREVNWMVAIDQYSETRPYVYLVVVDTKVKEGTAPKQAIVHGLVKPNDYSNALLGILNSRPSDDTGSGQNISGDGGGEGGGGSNPDKKQDDTGNGGESGGGDGGGGGDDDTGNNGDEGGGDVPEDEPDINEGASGGE